MAKRDSCPPCPSYKYKPKYKPKEEKSMARSKSDLISKGKTKYASSIKGLGGARAYYDCGAKGGMDVAICLAGLKEALTEDDWADRWATAME